MNIYIVTAGDYSDYHIEAVFTDKELAELYCQQYSTDSYGGDKHIEEYESDLFALQLREGLIVYRVRMYKNGDVEAGDPRPNKYSLGNMDVLRVQTYISFENDIKQEGLWLAGDVLATTPSQAIKIANEKRAELIALDKWAAE